MAIKLFGFNLGKKEVTQVEKPEQTSFVMPQAAVEDGAITVQSGAYYGKAGHRSRSNSPRYQSPPASASSAKSKKRVNRSPRTRTRYFGIFISFFKLQCWRVFFT